MAVEPQRVVPARIRAGHRHRNVSIVGVLPQAGCAASSTGGAGVIRAAAIGPGGVETSRRDARRDCRQAGCRLKCSRGARPMIDLPVVGLVDDALGLAAYIDMQALHALLREGAVLSGAALRIDPASEQLLTARLKTLPAVASVGFKRAMLRNFREILAANMNLSISLNVIFAGVIAFGVVYNAARVSLSERSRELASLRVLGFTRGEISLILLGELAVLTVIALPVGTLMGYGMARSIVQALDSEVYRFPLVISRASIAWAFIVTLAATLLSGLIVRRRLDTLDLVAVLKIRE